MFERIVSNNNSSYYVSPILRSSVMSLVALFTVSLWWQGCSCFFKATFVSLYCLEASTFNNDGMSFLSPLQHIHVEALLVTSSAYWFPREDNISVPISQQEISTYKIWNSFFIIATPNLQLKKLHIHAQGICTATGNISIRTARSTLV